MIGHRPSKLAALPTALLCFAPLSAPLRCKLKTRPPTSAHCSLLPAAQLDKALQETDQSRRQRVRRHRHSPGDASGSECGYKNDGS